MDRERTLVAGAGLMGHGIAQALAATGRRVALYEPELARATAGRDRIAGNLERSVAKGRLSAEDREAILGRIAADRRPRRRRATSDLVVEAVFEDVDDQDAALGASSTGSRRPARSSRRTPRRSRSTGWRRRSARSGGRGSSACTSSARSR